MAQSVTLDDKSREKVIKEISELQARVLQTLVPTILALGLIAVAASAKLGSSDGTGGFEPKIIMGCTFAILFTSGLFVAALSYKIQFNGNCLRVFPPRDSKKGEVDWEEAKRVYLGRPFLHKLLSPNPPKDVLGDSP